MHISNVDDYIIDHLFDVISKEDDILTIFNIKHYLSKKIPESDYYDDYYKYLSGNLQDTKYLKKIKNKKQIDNYLLIDHSEKIKIKSNNGKYFFTGCGGVLFIKDEKAERVKIYDSISTIHKKRHETFIHTIDKIEKVEFQYEGIKQELLFVFDKEMAALYIIKDNMGIRFGKNEFFYSPISFSYIKDFKINNNMVKIEEEKGIMSFSLAFKGNSLYLKNEKDIYKLFWCYNDNLEPVFAYMEDGPTAGSDRDKRGVDWDYEYEFTFDNVEILYG